MTGYSGVKFKGCTGVPVHPWAPKGWKVGSPSLCLTSSEIEYIYGILREPRGVLVHRYTPKAVATRLARVSVMKCGSPR